MLNLKFDKLHNLSVVVCLQGLAIYHSKFIVKVENAKGSIVVFRWNCFTVW